MLSSRDKVLLATQLIVYAMFFAMLAPTMMLVSVVYVITASLIHRVKKTNDAVKADEDA